MAPGRGVSSLRRIVAILAPHAAGEGPALAAGAALGVSVVVLSVVLPWPLKWILDSLAGQIERSSLLALAAVFVLLALAGAAAQYGQEMVLYGVGNRVVSRFRTALFGHLLHQPLSYLERRDLGELLTRIVYDTSRLRRGLNGLLIQVVQTIALFVAIVAVLWWHNSTVGTALAVGGLLALLAMVQRGRRIAKAARKQRRKEGKLAAMVAEELRSVRELQAFGLARSAVISRFGTRNVRSLRQEQKARRLASGLTFRVDVILALMVGMAIVVGSRAVANGRLSAGDLWLFLSYAAALRTPFTAFARQTARLGRTFACGERLVKLAERQSEIQDGPFNFSGFLRGELVFQEVSVKAPKHLRGGRKWTLHDVSCRFPQEKRIAVVGPNGSGKSTLLRVVLRLLDPTAGRVLLDGRDLREYTLASLRRQMSMVFQDSVLAGLSVRENIIFGLDDVSDLSLKVAATTARAHQFVEGLPQGYETRIRRGGDLLSGGERQRVALARALLRGGRVWLLDEPTAGLDEKTASDLVDALLEVTRGRTTLWVTHDPGLVSRLDWVLALDAGNVVFNGAPEAYRAWLGETKTSKLA